ncbi:MAG TPA: enoyl-CoA hydratase-related protein [Bacteroidia bacterium]|nr:enoyl-CoA hydratase-related protein [Bacteroidia bacterium]
MNFENILTSNNNGVVTITINRESKLNALNIKTLQEIKQAVNDVQEDKSVLGIILTGAGSKAFAAGADIAEFSNFSVDQGVEMSDAGHQVMNAIENSKKPVIAAVNGFALGGGCELAMACHMRVASENARFGQPEVNLGLIPGYAGTQRLVQLVGKGKALELLMTGDAINAHEAKSLGLVNHVVTLEELLPKCNEILDKIKTKAPLAIESVIRLANDYYAKDRNGYTNEIRDFGNFFGTKDFKEGVSAFLEKRKPGFSGE